MEIKPSTFLLGNIASGYRDDGEGGVFGYGGMLHIRPAYQREFVYRPAQQEAVVRSVLLGRPLNTMYFVESEGGDYEVLDGQQRIISICRYIGGDYSVDGFPFHSLPEDRQEAIRSYGLLVYLCTGTASEKLEWFDTINFAGEKLTEQERRNAIFHGSMLAEAKRWFSKTGGPSTGLGGDYIKGSAIRQDHLETAIKWIADGDIAGWMGSNQHRVEAAAELWGHFEQVIGWVERAFPIYRREMKGVDWGSLHRKFGDRSLDAGVLEKRVSELMAMDDVKRKSGVYSYVLDGDERHLSIRAFPDHIKRATYERQGGKCAITGETLPISEMDAHHKVPFSAGGRTEAANCEMVGRSAHRAHHAA